MIDTVTTVASAGDSLVAALRITGVPCAAKRGDPLTQEGNRPSNVILLETGYVVGAKRTVSGLQQNVAIYVPGDIVDQESFTLGVSRCGVVALTPVTFQRVQHARLRELLESDIHHAKAFCSYVSYHGALAHEWLLSLGRRSAYARTAHLLCEIMHRTYGTSVDQRIACAMPFTQTELADTLGLSVVHVNRTLMRLREEGLVRLRRGRIDIFDWARLKAAADFDPTYLGTAS